MFTYTEAISYIYMLVTGQSEASDKIEADKYTVLFSTVIFASKFPNLSKRRGRMENAGSSSDSLLFRSFFRSESHGEARVRRWKHRVSAVRKSGAPTGPWITPDIFSTFECWDPCWRYPKLPPVSARRDVHPIWIVQRRRINIGLSNRSSASRMSLGGPRGLARRVTCLSRCP